MAGGGTGKSPGAGRGEEKPSHVGEHHKAGAAGAAAEGFGLRPPRQRSQAGPERSHRQGTCPREGGGAWASCGRLPHVPHRRHRSVSAPRGPAHRSTWFARLRQSRDWKGRWVKTARPPSRTANYSARTTLPTRPRFCGHLLVLSFSCLSGALPSTENIFGTI